MSENSVSPLSIPTALAELAATATTLVAPYLRSVARSAPEVGLKQDIHDPVTVHDQRTEAIIRWFLAKFAPGSTVLGEEMGEELDPELVGDISEYVQLQPSRSPSRLLTSSHLFAVGFAGLSTPSMEPRTLLPASPTLELP